MKKFQITMIVTAAIGLTALILSLVINWASREKIPPRDNDKCTEEERVFDRADVLTDEEEEKLRELINETEPEIGCDIVLMTINDSGMASDYAMMNLADDFYDENFFGWNEPVGYDEGGDGAIFVANWGRDEYGDAYAWFSTTGKVEKKYSNQMIDALINKVCSKLVNDHYGAFAAYVKTLEQDMTARKGLKVPWLLYPVLGIIAAVAFILANLPKKAGENTTGKQTYVKQEDVHMLRKEDTFLNKSVTHVRIQSSSSGGGGRSGGGGHHTSSSGRSHGGGGGRF